MRFPDTFTIGAHSTPSPLVQISQVKGHLALLRAFAELRAKVESTSPEEWGVSNVPPDQERRWNWFVALAVER